MALPQLTKPVTRPHFVDPNSCVDLKIGDARDISATWTTLLFGANYNDPAPFRDPGYQQVMSSISTRRRF
jgi:cyanobactin biosynthesis protein (PatB/AcyB/McaB family)